MQLSCMEYVPTQILSGFTETNFIPYGLRLTLLAPFDGVLTRIACYPSQDTRVDMWVGWDSNVKFEKVFFFWDDVLLGSCSFHFDHETNGLHLVHNQWGLSVWSYSYQFRRNRKTFSVCSVVSFMQVLNRCLYLLWLEKFSLVHFFLYTAKY